MSIAHLLEDFEVSMTTAGRMQLISQELLEDERLASFEQGYSAGWDDAVAAQGESQAQLVAALSNNLEDLSFTYNEALSQMATSLEPMFDSLVQLVLPETMAQGFGQHIVEQLTEMATEQVAQPALLIVPKGVSRALKPILDRDFSFPVQLVEEATLPPGQASLRVGTAEREVNCSDLLDTISTAMSAFVYQAKEVSQHG
jgi:flagellar biosynthesis/type III secretory pathway protein FliH